MVSKAAPKYNKLKLPGHDGDITVYASPRILEALNEVTLDMDLYKGVKLSQILDSVYKQGQKDGRKEIFDNLDVNITSMKKEVVFMPPGRPRRAKKKQ